MELSYVDVAGVRMAYREVGDGDPVVFLHGNPTSSYLWRDVLGHVAPLGAAWRRTWSGWAGRDEYRRPYLRPGEDRRPTLTWPREIPLDGTPADVHRIVAANAEFMARTPIPKLFVNAEPGALLTGPLRETCRSWPAQHEITVPGLHFLPEDAPHEIGGALAGWLATLP